MAIIFVTKGKTNWKYILIIVILALIVAGESFLLLKQTTNIPETKLPEKITKDETVDWETYRNEYYKYEIKYPPDAKILPWPEAGAFSPRQENTTLIRLPAINPRIGGGTKEVWILARNLYPDEKCSIEYLLSYNIIDINIIETEIIQIDTLQFYKELEKGGSEDFTWERINYSTRRADTCVVLRLSFALIEPELFKVPPPPFDQEKEIETFNQMLSTFLFLE